MDELYDNLENYQEETTLAELREENKDLKFKLEEYAAALEKLQKDFDTLTIEHKRLEFNYSSLLKTARAEIERKTQFITKLNLEKDAMVLNSIQNRPHNRRWNKQTNNQETKFSKQPVNSNGNKNPSITNQISNDRTSVTSSKDDMNTNVNINPIPCTNVQTRLLDLVNKSVGSTGPGITKNEAKENIQLKDTSKSSAKISNRRKSMPAFGNDCPRFSPDEDELASTDCGRELMPRESGTQYSGRFSSKPNIEKSMSGNVESSRDLRTKLHKYDNDKPKNKEKYRRNQSPDKRNNTERRGSPDRRRASPDNRKVSAERKRGSPERRRVSPDRRRVSPDRRRVSPHRRRLSPDKRKLSPDRRRISPDRRRVSPSKRRISPDRRRVSPNRRRSSPNKYKKGSRDHSEELLQRQEYDRHRRLVSPPKEKYLDHKHQSREVQKSQELCHLQDFDRYKSHSQDRYSMKHKIPNDYEEPCKRMRHTSHHKVEDGSIAEPDFSYLHHLSCQSPEFNHAEAQMSHQIREIKLNATTVLEDPRKSSNRYSLQTHFGNPVITCVNDDNYDLKVIDPSGWNIIKMPDALLQKPDSTVMPYHLLQKPLPSAPDMLAKSNCDLSSDIAHGTDSTPNNSLAKSQEIDLDASTRPRTPTNIHQIISPMTQEPIQKEVTSDVPDILLQKHSISGSSTQPALPDMPVTPPQKTMSTAEIVNEVYMDIDNQMSNISVESGEIYDDLDVLPHQQTENTLPCVKSQNVEEHIEDTISRKELHNVEHCKDSVLSDKQPSPKDKCLNLTSKKHSNKTSIDASKIQDKIYSQSKATQDRNNDCPIEFTNYACTKEIIGDFEMSDDGTSDHTDVQLAKQTITSPHTEQVSVVDPTNNITAISKEHESVQDPHIGRKSKVSPLDKNTKIKKSSHKRKATQILHKTEDSILTTEKHVKQTDTPKEKFEEHDISLSMDELVKIRENLTNELRNKETEVSKEKPIKKKESKTKTSTVNKEPDTIDKSVKKKESKPKDSKHKTKATSANKNAPVANEPFKMKDSQNMEVETPEAKNTHKQRKKKQNVFEEDPAPSTVHNLKDKATKFNELFGDSSSLVSPEDLGLVPTVIPQEHYSTIFEDAQDATDIATIKAAVSSITTEKEKNDKQTNFIVGISSVDTPIIPQGSMQMNRESMTKQLVSSPTPIQSLYQNLQPEAIDKDNDIVKTVIISSGVQPQFISEVTETASTPNDRSEDLHVMQCVEPTVLQGKGMQALATSTPHKFWQQSVQLENPLPSSSHESRASSADKSPPIDISDNNTNNSQVNEADEPDMKIFVKRRRKVVKKK